MKNRFVKILSCFLCWQQIYFWGGFLPPPAWGKDKNLPIGELIVRGEAQYEIKKNTWNNIEFSYFPLFSGMKIKTKKGLANISLKGKCYLELSKDTLVLIEDADKLHLLQGKIDFRIPGQSELYIQVGKLIIQRTPSQQAAKGIYSSPEGETLGTIVLHPHGSVTIKNLKGNLSILNQNQQVLAALSPRDTFTMPAVLTNKPPEEKKAPLKIVQVGEEEIAPEPEKYAGISVKTWGIIGLAALGVTGALIASGGGGGGGGGAPACP